MVVTTTEFSAPRDIEPNHRYAWAVAAAKAAFPDANVYWNDMDWGSGFVIAVGKVVNGKLRRHAVKLEYSWIENPEDGERHFDEEDQQWKTWPPEGGWRYGHYSLNDTPDKEAALARLLNSLRRSLDGFSGG